MTAESNGSITVNGPRNATSKGGESQAVTPRVARETGAGVTRPRTAVIGKATDAVIRRTTGTETAAVAMIVVMIVVGAGERQPKVGDTLRQVLGTLRFPAYWRWCGHRT